MSSGRWRLNRRTVIGTTVSSIAVAVAGCAGDTDDEEPDDAGADGDDETGDESPEASQQPEDLDSPTEFPDGEACAVCNMITPDHPEWNAQLVKEDGTRVYFCSSGCMLAYYADPEHFDGEDEPVENVWVTDYETGELIDGQECYYVRVTESDHVDDIMMMNPTPFADRDGAEAFINDLNDEFDAEYNHEMDIITFDDFDMELAMMYRGRFLEEDEDHDDTADAPESFDLVDSEGEQIDMWMTDHWHTAVTVGEGDARMLYAENIVDADGDSIAIDGDHWELDARLADDTPTDIVSVHGHGDHVHLEGEAEGSAGIIFQFRHHGDIVLSTADDPMTVEVGDTPEDDDHEAADPPESFDLVDGDGEEIDMWMSDHWHTALTLEEGEMRTLFAEGVVDADGESIDVDGDNWELDARLADDASADVVSVHSQSDHVHVQADTEGSTEIIFQFRHHGEIALSTADDPMTVEVGDHDHDDA